MAPTKKLMPSDQPEIRNIRKTSEKIKNTISTVRYRSGTSVPKARIAVQAVCEIYGHKYHLSVSGSMAHQQFKRTRKQ